MVFEPFVQGMTVGLEGLPGQEYVLSMKCPEPDCDGNLILKHRGDGKPFYGCVRWPSCRGSVKAYPNGSPAGVPVDSATRKARAQVRALLNTVRQDEPVVSYQPGWFRTLLAEGQGVFRLDLLNRSACEEIRAHLLEDFPELRTRYDMLQDLDEDL